ncbi:hypothetical protein H072_6791 [Dactylellina haptotyla CBS 200.50]|uniref:Ubiquitin 3 binding protein But2 C-terminal domain-containing protein n=1 Tax=Dactylellina haptotyla (strain CBS 200.50) TaxID=1284197 RepID=S8AE97_DACHA|nr:hypothetical protein H072_6791 [Dactylellina haptotyla CBS 200.50]
MLRLLLSSLLVLGAAAVPAAKELTARDLTSIKIKVTGSGIAADSYAQFIDFNNANYVQLSSAADATAFSYDSSSQQLGAADVTAGTDVFSQTFFYQGDVYDETPSPISFKTQSDITDCSDVNICRYETWNYNTSAQSLTVDRPSLPKFYVCESDDGTQALLWIGPTSWTLCTPVTLSVVA